MQSKAEAGQEVWPQFNKATGIFLRVVKMHEILSFIFDWNSTVDDLPDEAAAPLA